MCLAIPGLVTELLDNDMAQVNVGGAKHVISLSLVDDVKVGDYVIVHVGYALSKIDHEEAQKTLALFEEFNAASAKHAAEGGA